MTTFALVHGGYHGAWCWEQLTPLLEQAGHGVVTMELPLEDGTATFDTYADVVCAALDDCGDDVVLVGHSYAGNTIPLGRRASTAAASRLSVRDDPRRRPQPGRAIDRQTGDAQPRVRTGIERARRSAVSAVDRARPSRATLFYFDCDEQIAQSALSRLRPQSVNPALFPFSLAEHPGCQRHTSCAATTRCCGPNGRDKPFVSGSPPSSSSFPGGHSPMLSRPQVLADVLLRRWLEGVIGLGAAGR